MGFDVMRHALLIGAMLTALSACSKEKAPAAVDDSGGPQVATSIDDVALPVDRSDQVTAIDATTGDASGMPKDGGAVIRTPKPEARPAVEAAVEAPTVATTPPPTTVPPPVVTPPPPPAGQ
jgi:hypothetical protein